ncbi:MAG: UvrD-helicase domain-containing protein, partial [Gammaproteobacteria bacterium]|nr:UvrD-helicase domain-containing protein [Gammaproteobacteria bacterium]
LTWQLGTNPSRLRIHTIDSFSASLTRQMPYLSRFGAPPSATEDAERLLRDTARNTLAHLNEQGPWSAAVARLLRHLDNNHPKAVELIAQMLARRDQWLRHLADGSDHAGRRARLEAALASINRAALARLAARAPAGHSKEIAALAHYASTQLAAQPEHALHACATLATWPGAGLGQRAHWQGLAVLLLTKDGGWRKKVDKNTGFPAKEKNGSRTENTQREEMKQRMTALLDNLRGQEAFQTALAELLVLPPPSYDEASWEVVESLSEVLMLAVAELKLEFTRRGEADFTEIAQGASRALGGPESPTDLALHLDCRIHHLLVDEFQDTSVSQHELLAKLTAGWQADDGRTLFVVGDPMQSIYRFRQAEVGLYLRARHEGIGGVRLTPLALTVNFRSQQGIVDWVNATFAQVLPVDEDIAAGAVPYASAVAHHPPEPGLAVHTHAFIDADHDAEAQRVAELVTAARAHNPQGKIAILVRSRAPLARIAPRLKQAGHAFRAVEIEPLAERPVVQDLLALTRALTHLADRTAWLALLRAPWCGLTLADLVTLVGNEDTASNNTSKIEAVIPAKAGIQEGLVTPLDSGFRRNDEQKSKIQSPLPQGEGKGEGGGSYTPQTQSTASIWTLLQDETRIARLSAAARQRIETVRTVLASALAMRGRSRFRQIVEGAWLALGGPACVDAPTDLEDARVYLDLLDELEEGGDITDSARLAEQVSELYALPDVTAGDALQLMTIHKAKGLEFDTVILPGLGSPPRHDDPPLLRWMETPHSRGAGYPADLLLAPIRETGGEHDLLYKYLGHLEADKSRYEAGRLLYVAATRAKRALHLLGTVKRGKDNAIKKPPASSLLALLWPVIKEEFVAALEHSAAPATAMDGGRFGLLPSRGITPSMEGRSAENAGSSFPLSAPGNLRRLVAGWQAPPLPPAVAWEAGAALSVPEGGPEVEFDWASETIRHVGSVVHRSLQLIGREGVARWPLARIEALAPGFRLALARQGVPEAQLDRAVQRVIEALRRTLTDAKGAWLFDQQHTEAKSEYALTRIEHGRPVTAIMDRSFVDANGIRWIVDYKTSTHEGGGLEAFLDREQERYRAQLERYARIMAQLDARPIRLGLYFPLLGGWREWSPAKTA